MTSYLFGAHACFWWVCNSLCPLFGATGDHLVRCGNACMNKLKGGLCGHALKAASCPPRALTEEKDCTSVLKGCTAERLRLAFADAQCVCDVLGCLLLYFHSFIFPLMLHSAEAGSVPIKRKNSLPIPDGKVLAVGISHTTFKNFPVGGIAVCKFQQAHLLAAPTT